MTTNRPLVILLFFLFLYDLAYSVPKLETRKEGSKRVWRRQGLPHSFESANENKDDEPAFSQINLNDKSSEPFEDNNQPGDYNNEDLDANNDGIVPTEYVDGGDDTLQTPSDYEQPNYDDPPNNENEPIYDDQPADNSKEDVYINNDDDDDNMLGYLDEVKSEEHVDSNEYVNLESEEYDEMSLTVSTRAMQVGDTFAAKEMLPIAKKLMNKIGKRRGKGKGIISSAVYSKNLADILFERYFLTMKRIVILKDVDIAGLDALQALALSGEAAASRTAAYSVTESPSYKRGETLFEENPIRKCHYRLLRKNMDGKIPTASKRNIKRHRVDISKKLAKNRKLVLNPAQRRANVKQAQNQKYKKETSRLKKGDSKSKDVCYWRYECTEAALESCGLHIDCSQDAKLNNYIGFRLKEDEFTEPMKEFRRMVGIEVIDEEVEKIMEKHFIALQPRKLESSEKLESLAEFFNKIMIRDELEGLNTSPRPAPLDTSAEPDEDSTIIIPPLTTPSPDGSYEYEAPQESGENEPGNADEELQDDENDEVIPESGDEAVVENESEAVSPEDEELIPEPVQDDENDEVIPESGDEAVVGNESEAVSPEDEELIPEPVQYPDAADLEMSDDNDKDLPTPKNGSLAAHIVVLESKTNLLRNAATTNKPNKT